MYGTGGSSGLTLHTGESWHYLGDVLTVILKSGLNAINSLFKSVNATLPSAEPRQRRRLVKP